jgi:hypothetical protein
MKFYKAPWQILICFISTFCLTLFNPAYSQEELLAVGSEGEMTILGGTDFSIDKLVITPSRDYAIRNNTVSITKSKLFTSGRTISSTYQFEHNPNPFTGKIMVGLQEKAPESRYDIHLFDNTKWAPLESQVVGFGRRSMVSDVTSSKITRAITVAETHSSKSFEIITNPAVNKVISVSIQETGEYFVTTIDGKILFSLKLSPGVHQISLSQLAHSTYLLSNRKQTEKFIL